MCMAIPFAVGLDAVVGDRCLRPCFDAFAETQRTSRILAFIAPVALGAPALVLLEKLLTHNGRVVLKGLGLAA